MILPDLDESIPANFLYRCYVCVVMYYWLLFTIDLLFYCGTHIVDAYVDFCPHFYACFYTASIY